MAVSVIPSRTGQYRFGRELFFKVFRETIGLSLRVNQYVNNLSAGLSVMLYL